MARREGVRVAGLKEVEAGLRRMADEVGAGLPSAASELAQAIARQAATLAPRRTGRLASSIHAEGAQVVADAPYGGAIEVGTRRGVRAHHFMSRAADSVDPEPFYDKAAQAAADRVKGT